MKRFKSKKHRAVTYVTGGILVIFSLFSLPMASRAQTVQTPGESLKNGVSGPINELVKPVEDLKNQLNTKIPKLGENVGGQIKGFLDRNNITTDSVGGSLSGLVGWFKERMDSFNSPAFISWAVDFIKRIFLLALELTNKLVSYL